MKKTQVEIVTHKLGELTPAAHAHALQRIAQVIQHIWASDPTVQQMVGLRPTSTPEDVKLAEPRVHGWITMMQAKLEAQIDFLPSGEPFDVDRFSKAIVFVPPEQPDAPALLVPEKRLVGPDGRPLQ